MGSTKMAMQMIQRDIDGGADMCIIKPGIFYLDVIKEASQRFDYPIVAYQTCGEYSMLYYSAKEHGCFGFDAVLKENALAYARAGVSMLITSFTPRFLDILE